MQSVLYWLLFFLLIFIKLCNFNRIKSSHRLLSLSPIPTDFFHDFVENLTYRLFFLLHSSLLPFFYFSSVLLYPHAFDKCIDQLDKLKTSFPPLLFLSSPIILIFSNFVILV